MKNAIENHSFVAQHSHYLFTLSPLKKKKRDLSVHKKFRISDMNRMWSVTFGKYHILSTTKQPLQSRTKIPHVEYTVRVMKKSEKWRVFGSHFESQKPFTFWSFLHWFRIILRDIRKFLLRFSGSNYSHKLYIAETLKLRVSAMKSGNSHKSIKLPLTTLARHQP